jgi:tetratricopeptide (TPR) repeat protein
VPLTSFHDEAAQMAMSVSERRDTEQAESWYRTGLQANQEGDSLRARASFMQALAIQPHRPGFLLSAGNMYLKLGQPAKALGFYEVCETRQKTAAQAAMLDAKMRRARHALAAQREKEKGEAHHIESLSSTNPIDGFAGWISKQFLRVERRSSGWREIEVIKGPATPGGSPTKEYFQKEKCERLEEQVVELRKQVERAHAELVLLYANRAKAENHARETGVTAPAAPSGAAGAEGGELPGWEMKLVGEPLNMALEGARDELSAMLSAARAEAAGAIEVEAIKEVIKEVVRNTGTKPNRLHDANQCLFGINRE